MAASSSSSSSSRPGARRQPSGPWSRLRPSNSDPLESVGLPSKGETRLNDFKAQENYYAKITERYVKFCADAGNRNELERRFASFTLTDKNDVAESSNDGKTAVGPQIHQQPSSGKLQKQDPARKMSSTTDTSAATTPADQTELNILLAAMRKLRESLVATHRVDSFAQRAYAFLIRAAILVKSYPNYHPALLYLLSSIHPRTTLPQAELHEFIGYRILDLACREGDLSEAHRLRVQHAYADRRVEKVLKALAHDDWVVFWRVRRQVDGHQRRLMEWAEDGMRMHALKCLGRSYFTADRAYVEKCADLGWDELVAKCGVGWELDRESNKVTIRRPKVK